MIHCYLRLWGCALKCAAPTPPCLTPATTIVVVPVARATGTLAKAGTTIVAMESVRVAAPPWVPEVARTPLRERTGLSLSNGRRSQTGEP
jgi:hypothetical protein